MPSWAVVALVACAIVFTFGSLFLQALQDRRERREWERRYQLELREYRLKRDRTP